MRVLIACEFSGIVRDAFREAGHFAVSCDLLPSERVDGMHYRGDVRDILGELPWDLMVAHPPCTHLASSGARWFAAKRAEQEEALDFIRTLMAAPIPRIALENPVGVISTRIRRPDQIVQPWWFGDPETKTTCWWLTNLPLLVPTDEVEPDWVRKPDGSYYTDAKGKRYSRVHFESGHHDAGRGGERWRRRSRSYAGMARAMAEQWGSLGAIPWRRMPEPRRERLPAGYRQTTMAEVMG